MSSLPVNVYISHLREPCFLSQCHKSAVSLMLSRVRQMLVTEHHKPKLLQFLLNQNIALMLHL